MNSVTIDIGNTKVKIAVWNELGLLFQHTSSGLSYEGVKEVAEEYSADKGIVSTVRGKEEEIESELSCITGIKFILFNQPEIKKYKERIRYKFPIGTDRVAAYLGAESIWPTTGKLIIDAGTAITLDVVDNKGIFMGGDISLGLSGRLNSLHHATALLPNVEAKESGYPFGIDTKSAIVNGAINGVAGEMLYAFERGLKNYKTEKVVLTGGDGERFVSFFTDRGINCSFDPLLVSRGLDFHLRNH